MIIEIVERGISGVYHLAGTIRTSRYNFARLIAKHFNLNEQLIIPTTSDQIKWLARRPKDSSLNVQKAQQILKNKPLEIEESIRIMKNEKVLNDLNS
jgi:dTDP-4-dehydrorhamnose reductase